MPIVVKELLLTNLSSPQCVVLLDWPNIFKQWPVKSLSPPPPTLSSSFIFQAQKYVKNLVLTLSKYIFFSNKKFPHTPSFRLKKHFLMDCVPRTLDPKNILFL